MIGEPYEPLTREQLEAEAERGRDLGRLVRTRWEGFTEAGFSQSEAVTLARDWLAEYMRHGHREDHEL